VQVIALHVADHLPVQVQLVQVAAAVIQVVELAAIRQGQRGQVAERVVLIAWLVVSELKQNLNL